MSFKHVLFRSNLFKDVQTFFLDFFLVRRCPPVDTKPTHGFHLSDESLQVPWQQVDRQLTWQIMAKFPTDGIIVFFKTELSMDAALKHPTLKHP